VIRLKIAAVAATAAVRFLWETKVMFFRLKIAAVAATAAGNYDNPICHHRPPQDCRSRGDCGSRVG